MSPDSPKAAVIRMLKDWMSSGRLGPGDIVPSERALAEELNVARGTVRAALEELVSQELIVASKHCSRRVASTPGQPSSLMGSTVAIVSSLLPRPGASAEHTGHEEASVYYTALYSLSESGYHVLTVNPELLARADAQADSLLQHRPRGVLVVSEVFGDEAVASFLVALKERGIPFVVYTESSEAKAYDRVTSDHEEGAYKLVKWLAERGRRRILRLWPEMVIGRPWVALRDRGYERGCREARIKSLPTVTFPSDPHFASSAKSFERASRELVGHLVEHLNGKKRIDSIMCVADEFTYAATRACKLCGLEPGKDIDIVGYDDVWRYASSKEYVRPGISATVNKHNATIAEEMIRLLDARMSGKLLDDPQHVVVCPSLVEVTKSMRAK